MPDIPGYKDCWGKAMPPRPLHRRPRHPSLTPAFANHVARLFNQHARSIAIYTNGAEDLAHDIRALVAKRPNIHLNSRPIRQLALESVEDVNVRVEFVEGGDARHALLMHTPRAVPNVEFAGG
ncbi:MAG: hypothetical protein FRX48_01977 [Lasallia pustulata]|uniref:Uncharacterized protein n=1 Tax=Lasallia pustulata TaxID=136370 RepID=A0A5M8Q2K7_9LECA|nr:MAG: hypothetical protein FRX48_01977 [Lasallia pustulata]